MSKMLTTRQAAERLGLPKKEVVRRIRIGDIKATKFDWIWVIEEAELDAIRATDWYKRAIAA